MTTKPTTDHAQQPRHAPLVLLIRDGWGYNPNHEHRAFNAVRLAHTPVADAIAKDWPTTLVSTSGIDVGLPEGTMGNSEVGHQNIGAGRIVDQDAVRVSKAIQDGDFFENDAIVAAVQHAKENDRAVHIMGICSDAGVHGRLSHLYACVELCKRRGHRKVYVHCFTDGRDSGPFTGAGYVAQVEAKLAEIGVGTIASVVGRYDAMDRDNRWARTRRAYACLTGDGTHENGVRTATSASRAVQQHYQAPEDPGKVGDEFIPPTMIAGSEQAARASRIARNDAVVFYNYRGDRPRQLCRALLLEDLQNEAEPSPENGERGFRRTKKYDLRFVCMTPYAPDIAERCGVAFEKPLDMKGTLGAHLETSGIKQFRCAETEKFPHVTFFFNDYRETPFHGEARAIRQSPKDVPTYDLKPEMNAKGVCDAVLNRLDAQSTEPVLIVNLANGDMVGHTGNLQATIKACETVDRHVGEIVQRTLQHGGCCIVTADHGNAEQMWDPETGAPHTAHTLYKVPLHVVGEPFRGRALRDGGRLADVAPTCLDMLGLPAPTEMTGVSLLCAQTKRPNGGA